MNPDQANPLSRRQAATAAVAAVAGMGALSACGGSSSSSSSGGGSSSGAAGVLAKLSDVAVGSAFSATGADGKPIIIAQPTAGNVVAHTAICTHRGCTVRPAGGLNLKCPCHGSTYDAATGKNTGGPSPAPLAAVPVKVEGGSIVAG